jgi:hypothetical protein
MANEVSISIEKGVDGFKIDDFTVGTEVPDADDIEVRISDTTAINRKQVIIGLKAIVRHLESGNPISGLDGPEL